jgi:hypothetical protein
MRHAGLLVFGDPGLCYQTSYLNVGLGYQRYHCNEEGFGTLSRQLENDEGYRSSRVGVSGLSPVASVPQMGSRSSVGEGQGQEKPHRAAFQTPA